MTKPIEKFRVVLVTILLALFLSGCASFGGTGSDSTNRLVVQYATLKVIEQSDSITTATIIEHLDRAEALLDSDQVVSLDTLIARVDLAGLDAADRLLVAHLLSSIQDSAVEVPDTERHVRLREVFGWVRQATSYANPNS